MVSKQSLGKVAIIPKGEYNSATEYQLYDLVSYQGNSYLAVRDKNKGRSPTNSYYWQLLAAGGGGSPILGEDSILSWTS